MRGARPVLSTGITQAAAVFSSAFLLRLFLLGKGPYHFDVVEVIQAAQKLLATGRLHYMHGAGYPLHVGLASLFILAGRALGIDDPVTAVNLMAALFGSLAVTALYLCVRRLLDDMTALFSAALFSVFPGFLSATVYGINNGVSSFFALTALLFMLRSLQSGRMSGLIISGLAMAASVSVRLPDFLFCVPLLVLYLVWQGRAARFPAGFVLPLALVPALFYIPMVSDGQAGQMIGALTDSAQGKFSGFFSPVLAVSFDWMVSMLTPAGIALSIAGAIALFKNRRKVFIFLFVWFLTMFLYYGNVSTVEPRMLIMAGVPALIFSGYCFSRLSRLRSGSMAALAAFSALTVMMALAVFPALWFRHTHDQAGDYFQWLKRNTEPEAEIIAADEIIFINFYASRAGVAPPASCDPAAIRTFFKEQIDPKLARAVPLYVVDTAGAYDRCGLFTDYLRKHYRLIRVGASLNEDWHHACLRLKLHEEALYRILPGQRSWK